MTNYERSLIEKLNRLIEEKYINAESITENLCHDLGISRSNLYRLLKDNFQLSPSLYIRKIKIIKAKQLLLNSEMKIGEIAYFIGLDSPQNFTKYFTQEFGISPTEYKKKELETNILKEKEKEEYEEEAVFKPILTKRKSTITEKLSFIIPGIIVFVLTAFGYVVWKNNYAAPDEKSEINEENKKPIVVLLPFLKPKNESPNLFANNLQSEINKQLLSNNNLIIFKNMPNLITNDSLLNNLKITYSITGQVFERIGGKVKVTISLNNIGQKKIEFTKTYQYPEAEINNFTKTIASDLVKNMNEFLKSKSNLQSLKLNNYSNKYLSQSNIFIISILLWNHF